MARARTNLSPNTGPSREAVPLGPRRAKGQGGGVPQLRRAAVDQRVRRVQLLQSDRYQRTVRLGPRQHHTSIGVARMNPNDDPSSERFAPDPAAPGGGDGSGWSQPPAPQSPGPPGAFVDRPAAPPRAPLPPGAGSPVQPGPPMSVNAPISDTTINRTALLVGGVIVVRVVIVIVVILIAVLSHRPQ